jgi:hypothetical protein
MPEQSPNKWKGLVAAILTSDFPARVRMRSVNYAKWLQLRRREGEQEWVLAQSWCSAELGSGKGERAVTRRQLFHTSGV